MSINFSFQNTEGINLLVVNWVDANDMNYFQSVANAKTVSSRLGVTLNAIVSIFWQLMAWY